MAVQVRGKLPGKNITRTFNEVRGRKDYPCSVWRKNIKLQYDK